MPVVLRWLLRLGPLNPISVRLVQGGSRRRRHMYIRAGYLAAITLALLWLLFTNATSTSLSTRDLAAAAASSFEFVAYVQILLICLLAPVFMAGAIAQEANPRTWDILLTTPMSAGEIVLGNLLGRLFFILALLFSSLPLFALTQLFGGVPGTTIFKSYLIAACAAMFVGTLAIALSVSRLVGKRAVFAFYVGVVSFLAITYAIDRLRASPNVVSYMTSINPFLALKALLDPTNYARFPEGSQYGIKGWLLESPVGAFCTISGVLSLVLMAASTITVRAGGIAGLGGQGGRGGVPWYRKMFGLGAKGAEHRAPKHVWANPIAWREAAARNATFGRMLARWGFILIGAAWGIGIVVYTHINGRTITSDDYRAVVLYTVMGELFVVMLVALNMAATSVAREREDGTLDLLLTTPITPPQYLAGKVRGMVAYLLPLLAVPVGTLLISGLYVLLVEMRVLVHPAGIKGVQVSYMPPATGGATPTAIWLPAILPEAGIVLGIVVVPFVAFCCLVGINFSLKSKGTIGAVVQTVGVVGVVAGIVGLCAYKLGEGVPLIGPVLTASTPITAAFAGTMVEAGLKATIDGRGLEVGRAALLIGALVSSGIWIGVVYALRANIVHNFDMTVRRLAGTA